MTHMETVEAAEQQLKEIAQRQVELVNETAADRKRMNEISAVIESLSGAMEELKALQGKIKQTEMLAAKLPQAVEAREKGAAMKADANRLQQEVLDLARRKDRLLEEKNSLMQSLPGLDDTSDLETSRNKAVQDQRIATINLGSISAKLERIRGRAAQHGTAQSQYANFGYQPRPHHESTVPADDHRGGGGERQHRLYGVTKRRRYRGRADELSA